MLHAHTVEQVRAAEGEFLARLPEGTLMQRAAAGLASAVADFLGSAYGRRVLLLVGTGDNGGDALWAGAMLARRGAWVEAWLLGDRAHPEGLAALRRAGGRLVEAPTRRPEVVLDGIVGIGGRPGLSPRASNALKLLHGVPIVAVDTPSGVDVDSGQIEGEHVTAALTVTFGTLKPCHLLDPGASACGAVHLVDIGLDLPDAAIEALQPEDVTALLPRPAPDAHKYTRGVVGVRAGSAEYPGAALLSVAGASCGVAGMLRYAGDEAVATTVRQRHPEVVGAGRVQAWVVGSGSGEHAERQLRDALDDKVPIVVDADALGHLQPAYLQPGQAAVLTPHAGELARMLQVERTLIEARPLEHARRASQAYQCVVVLKGRRTVIAAPDGRVRVNTSGTPWLATAGAGDVLGGLVGALLAAGLTAYDAASVGAWLHGAAATYAGGGGPITAAEVAAAIPAVLRDLLTEETGA